MMTVFIAGCAGSEGMPEEELAAKTDLNAIARKAHTEGLTWDTLPQTDKDAYIAHYKDEAKAKDQFNKALEGMKYFFGGGGTPGAGMNPGGR